MPNNQLDPGAVNLAKAIRETESGGNWNAKGKSGEWGAYQFTPATWDAYAKEAGVNAVFGSATPDQQNEVAYKKIKQWKDQGYNVGQVASMWNAGVGKPNAYLENHKGVNSLGVAYDTPAYAQKVAQAYQRLKGQTGTSQQQTQDIPSDQKDVFTDMGDRLGKAGSDIANAVGDTLRPQGDPQKINLASGLIRGVGGVAEGALGLVDSAIEHTPVVGDVYKGITGAVGQGVKGFMETPTGQNISSAYGEFAQNHPELAGDIKSGVDIASALPLLKGFRMAKEGVNTLLHGGEDAVLETVSPRLTPKQMAEAVATRGTENKGLLRTTVLKADPYAQKIATAIRTSVPRFNPGKSLLYNIGATQTVVSKMAKDLKKAINELGDGRIYSYKEFASELGNIERPLLISSDTTLNNAYNKVIAKAVEIAKKKGGKVSNLLDVRQEFDKFVERQFPNLYSSEALTPMRQAIKDVRNAITDFTVKNLPEGSGLKENLLQQHYLISAIENMSEKATKGAGKELGLNAFDRLGKRHPLIKGLVKAGGRAIGQGVGVGGVMRVMD